MEFLIYFVKTLGLLFVAILLLYLIIAIIKTPIYEEKKRKVTNEKLNELLQQINDDLDKVRKIKILKNNIFFYIKM